MTIKSQLFVFAILAITQLASFPSEARRKHDADNRNRGGRQEQNQGDGRSAVVPASAGDTDDDEAIVKAVEARMRRNFVQGGQMVVTKILPDDNSGLKHQKWMVRLSNGQQMMAVYNSDMCERVPLKVGDVVAMGGQFIWTNDGGLLHWLHHDPRQNRPDGFVQLNGKFYCKD